MNYKDMLKDRMPETFDSVGIEDGKDGIENLVVRLKAFCREQGLVPSCYRVFPSDGNLKCYAVALHLTGKDRWEQFDADVVFMLEDLSAREEREMEAGRMRCMFEELGEPIVLTSRFSESPENQRFYANLGMTKIPVTWADYHQQEYEVFAKGQMEMGSFVNLMERIEYIGKEIIYKDGRQ